MTEIRTIRYEKKWKTTFQETGHGMGLLKIPQDAKDLVAKIKETLKNKAYKIGCACNPQYVEFSDNHQPIIYQLQITDPRKTFDGLKPKENNPEYVLRLEVQSDVNRKYYSWLNTALILGNEFEKLKD